jgi:hypothetical protein
MPGFDTVATKSHHHQPVNATTLVLGWKLVTALGIDGMNIDLLFCCFYEDNLVTLKAKKDFGVLTLFVR